MQEISDALLNYGYVILFVYSLGGGMVALIAAGFLAGADKLNIGICVVLAAFANFIGDTLLFYIARFNKTEILPKMRKYRRQLALAQILFKRHGAKIILFKKYIYGLKTLIPLAIGVSKFGFVKFSIINAVSAVIWALSVGLSSYLAGDFISRVSSEFGEKTAVYIGIAMIALIMVWIFANSKRRKKI